LTHCPTEDLIRAADQIVDERKSSASALPEFGGYKEDAKAKRFRKSRNRLDAKSLVFDTLKARQALGMDASITLDSGAEKPTIARDTNQRAQMTPSEFMANWSYENALERASKDYSGKETKELKKLGKAGYDKKVGAMLKADHIREIETSLGLDDEMNKSLSRSPRKGNHHS
jgi:hypothetical protein